jgi:hypothetical protein
MTGGSGVWNYNITGFLPTAPTACRLDFIQGVVYSGTSPAGGVLIPVQQFLCPYDLDTSKSVSADITWSASTAFTAELFMRLSIGSFAGAPFPRAGGGLCEYAAGVVNTGAPIPYNSSPFSLTQTFILNPADVSNLEPGKTMFYTSAFVSFSGYFIRLPGIKITLNYTSK